MTKVTGAATGARGAVILAGGASRRFGGDKALARLNGKPLIAHVIDRLSGPQTVLAINAPVREAYAEFGLPLVPDSLEGGLGPLAGVLTAMHWAAAQGLDKVLTAPADTPFLPQGLFSALSGAEAPVVMARSSGQVHQVCALWSCALADDLEAVLRSGEVRAVWAYAERHGRALVDFEPSGGVDAFFNINTPADLDLAAMQLTSRPGGS